MYHIDASEAEKRGRSEKVPVVRIDIPEGVFGRAGEMKGIGGSKKSRWRRFLENVLQTLLYTIRKIEANQIARVEEWCISAHRDPQKSVPLCHELLWLDGKHRPSWL